MVLSHPDQHRDTVGFGWHGIRALLLGNDSPKPPSESTGNAARRATRTLRRAEWREHGREPRILGHDKSREGLPAPSPLVPHPAVVGSLTEQLFSSSFQEG